jgi:glycosyltransferase involved in cell wall biosynthesis
MADGRREIAVATVMPAFNAGAFVREAIESVRAQSLGDVQLVVVDDGSTDETPQIARSIQDERVVVLSGPRRGPSAARNAGVAAAAASRYLAFLDADDLWDVQKLAEQTAFLDANPGVLAVGSFTRYISSTGRPLGRTGQAITPVEQGRIARGELLPFHLSALVFRRRAFAAAGGFDDFLGTQGSEDLDFYSRLARLGPMACLPRVLGSIRVHPDSAMARRRRQIHRAARFVRQRLLAREQGRELSWDEFADNYRDSWRDRQQDAVERLYRAAALSVGELQYARALAYTGLAMLVNPSYTLRRVYRQRLARG